MNTQDQEATFRRWLDEHVGLMLKVVRGCVASPQDQDDLFQDVLLQIWSSIPAFRGTFAPDGTGYWLWTEAVPFHELGAGLSPQLKSLSKRTSHQCTFIHWLPFWLLGFWHLDPSQPGLASSPPQDH
jgi:hypothetical protein